jgi:hypothetical protein
VSLGLAVFFLFDALQVHSIRNPGRTQVQFVVAGFFVLYTVYYLFRSSWVLWAWYSYPLVLFSAFILPFLIQKVIIRFEMYPSYLRMLKTLLTTFSLLLIVAVTNLLLKTGIWADTAQPSFKYPNYLAAQILNDRLPVPSTIAMGDQAGSLAYFFDGNVLQLEGLLGDYQLLHAIDTDQLMNYMNKFGVEYVVSYTKPPPNYVKWELLSPLPRLTSGPNATILLCKESEYLYIDSQISALYIWSWPSCRD